MPLKDKEARRAYQTRHARERYQTDPAYRERQKAAVKASDKRRKVNVGVEIRAFKEQGCRLCGESAQCCLVAHHLDATTKDFNLGDANKDGFGPRRVKVELAKCVCLCQNCHSKVHAGLLTLDLPGGNTRC